MSLHLDFNGNECFRTFLQALDLVFVPGHTIVWLELFWIK